jgi:hypothetical protein
VEALKDGLIEDGQHYSFTYENSNIIINGKRPPQAAESRYLKLIQDFYANGSTSLPPTSWVMESDSLSMADVLNPASDYRMRGPWHHTNRKPGKQLIIEEMARDRLVDTTRPVHVDYTQKALTVNGQPLSQAMSEKYAMLIRILEGFVPRKESDIYSINR